jgi:aspartate aminotransferase-like enzyme
VTTFPKRKLIMLPGPVDVSDEVLAALSKPIISHRGSDFHTIMANIERMAKGIFRTNSSVYVFTASGTGGVEAAVLNIVRPGDKVVVPVFGEFGSRMANQIERARGNVIKVESPMGTAPEVEKVKEAFENNENIKALFIVYNDTSPGITYRYLKEVTSIAKEHGAFVVVDAISIFGGDELPQDEWGIDVVIAGTQKCLAMPPGLVLVSASPQVVEYVEKNPPITTYFDFARHEKFLAKNETPVTPAIPLFYALEESLEAITNEGLDNRIRRHKVTSQALYSGLMAAGLEPFVEERFRSNVVITMKYPEGVSDKEFRETLNHKFDMVIAGGFGELKGKIFRIGNMGNVGPSKVLRALTSIGGALNLLGLNVNINEMIAAAEEKLSRL